MTEYHLEIWDARGNIPDACLVWVASIDRIEGYLSEPCVEQGPSLADIDAMGGYIKQQFPEGWVVRAGQIVDARGREEESNV